MEGIRRDTREVVERLEGQVARLRAMVWFLFLALVAAAGAFVWRQRHPKAVPDVVKVKGIFVEDGNGPGRMLLTGHGIMITDDDGKPRINLSVDDKGNTQFALKDAQGSQALEASPASVSLTDGKKDAAVMTTANGATIQLRRADKVVFKQPWDAPEAK